jgi:hypothetical protein
MAVCGVLTAAAVFFNLGFITTPLCGYNDYLVDLRAARRLTAELTAPEIQALNILHKSQPIKVLCVGDAEVFDADFPVVYNTVFDRSIFQEWCAAEQPGVPAAQLTLRDADENRRKLREEAITHIYVNWSEILRYRTTYGYTDFVTPARFDQLRAEGVIAAALAGTPFFREFDTLGKAEQAEVEAWGALLIRTVSGNRVLVTAEIFPVVP